jgi:hypothetical protein
MATTGQLHTVADWITLWVGDGDGSIMIKTREPHGDPVEPSHDEAVELVDRLRELIEQIT